MKQTDEGQAYMNAMQFCIDAIKGGHMNVDDADRYMSNHIDEARRARQEAQWERESNSRRVHRFFA